MRPSQNSLGCIAPVTAPRAARESARKTSRHHARAASTGIYQFLLRVAIAIALVKAVQAAPLGASVEAPTSRPSTLEAGEFGGDLNWLKSHYQAPDNPESGNHIIDLWEGRKLSNYAAAAGLANNRTLFINSHGRGRWRKLHRRFAMHPHETLVPGGTPAPNYSVADVAAIVGPSAAARIHNIVVTACNKESALSLREFLAHFPNATNIIHAARGEAGYQPMLHQMLFRHSSQVETLYEVSLSSRDGQPGFMLENRPARHSKQLTPYVADLFLPGQTRPYRSQKAGRELLEARTAPSSRSALSTRVSP